MTPTVAKCCLSDVYASSVPILRGPGRPPLLCRPRRVPTELCFPRREAGRDADQRRRLTIGLPVTGHHGNRSVADLGPQTPPDPAGDVTWSRVTSRGVGDVTGSHAPGPGRVWGLRSVRCLHRHRGSGAAVSPSAGGAGRLPGAARRAASGVFRSAPELR